MPLHMTKVAYQAQSLEEMHGWFASRGEIARLTERFSHQPGAIGRLFAAMPDQDSVFRSAGVTDSAISVRSIQVPAFHAATMPIGTARTTANVMVSNVSHSVGSMRCPMSRGAMAAGAPERSRRSPARKASRPGTGASAWRRSSTTHRFQHSQALIAPACCSGPGRSN